MTLELVRLKLKRSPIFLTRQGCGRVSREKHKAPRSARLRKHCGQNSVLAYLDPPTTGAVRSRSKTLRVPLASQ